MLKKLSLVEGDMKLGQLLKDVHVQVSSFGRIMLKMNTEDHTMLQHEWFKTIEYPPHYGRCKDGPQQCYVSEWSTRIGE